MALKYDDPEFSGAKIFNKSIPIPTVIVLILNILLTISPFGLFATRTDLSNNRIDHFSTWFSRIFSAVCCYGWYKLFF